MAASNKYDPSSDITDRQVYNSGQRGSHVAARFDRSGSFRESMENPILSSLPSMTRSSSMLAQGDVVNFFQCLRFDPKVVAAEHKSNRLGDFKLYLNTALGISADDSPSSSMKGNVIPSLEEIKRAKAALRESSVKARERVKIFNEALSVFNKFFPTIPSKKRSRSEGFSNDRHGALLSSNRSAQGQNIGKLGVQNPAVSGGFEVEQQKSDERTKNAVPNKRTRTSLDLRMKSNRATSMLQSNALVRPPGNIDREKDTVRLANGGAIHGDDRTLSVGIDGWEKTKMKKKRSGIKPDVSPNVLSSKPSDGYREVKQGTQQRASMDAGSRLSNDSILFRTGVANGAAGVGKSDGIAQPTIGSNMRSSISKTDIDNNSLVENSERSIGLDKERINHRTLTKASVREDFNSASPTSSTKLSAPIRAPRSGSGVAPKLSPVVHRTTALNDWELSQCTNKPPTVGAGNRKRTTSARSSSPPVAQWAGQRPQKNSRTARRTNLIPIVSNANESSHLDTVSDVSGSENGWGVGRRLTGNSPQRFKVKADPTSSAVFSENEESGASEIRSKEKSKKSDEVDEKTEQNVQKVSSLGASSRKNKLVTGEDLGDGVRRQGRTGRGFGSARSPMPMDVEKPGNLGNAKQLQNTRTGLDKNESKGGRPPTRKLSERKGFSRQKHMAVNATAEFLVGSENGHEELLAAARAVVDPAPACSSSFWGLMEPIFGFVPDSEINYLKQSGNMEYIALSSWSEVNNQGNTANKGLQKVENGVPEQLVPEASDISLCHILMSAIISDGDYPLGYEDPEFDEYQTESQSEVETGSNGFDHIDTSNFSGHGGLNGHKMTERPGNGEADNYMLGNRSSNSHWGNPLNGVIPIQALVPGAACLDFEYESMSIDEKLRLELQIVGIFSEPISEKQREDEGILGDIKKLEGKYLGQVSKKKGLLDKLLKSASERKETQEKELELLAFDKLVTNAYERYMTSRGHNTSGWKSSTNKMAKQVALAFVKWTLEQCHAFEDTGISCFNERAFRSMFISGSAHPLGALSSVVDGEIEKPPADSPCGSLDAKFSASLVSLPSPGTSQLGPSLDGYSFDLYSPREDAWSNRMKKRELSLDDVGTASSSPSGLVGSLSSNTRGKRSDRDRDGKGQNRENLSRVGQQTLSNNVKGERKSKAKPKQKTQSDQRKERLPSDSKPTSTTNNNEKDKDGFGLGLDDPEGIDFSNIAGIDELDDVNDQDLGSWLNIDDDGLQDLDFMGGLEIPMDDLSDLNMML